MQGGTLDNTLYHINRVSYIRLGQIVSGCLGFLLVFSAPLPVGFSSNMLIPWSMLIPLGETYTINFFEGFAIIVSCFALAFYGIRITRSERFLFFSIIFIIFTRILSLLAANQAEIVQIVSVFRYVSTLVIVYIFANLFTASNNRRAFIWGIIIGVAIETPMGIYIALSSVERGIFISIVASFLQVFLTIVCLLVYAKKKHRFVMIMLILILLLGINATQTRFALIQLITVLLATMWYLRRQREILKPFIFIIVFSSMAIFLSAILFPFIFEPILERIARSAIAENNMSRIYLFDKALAAFLQEPITGVGSGGFARIQDSLPQIFSFEVSRYDVEEFDKLSTQNTFLGVLCETGVVGLTAYFMWVIGVIAISIKILKLANIKSNGDVYTIAACLMVIMFTVADLWSLNSFYPIPNSLLGFMLGWFRANTKRKGALTVYDGCHSCRR